MTPSASIRRRLQVSLTVGIGLLLGACGVVLDGAMRRHLAAEFDATLGAKLRALASLTEQENGQIEFDYVPGSMPEFDEDNGSGPPREYFQFWLDDGSMLLRSNSLPADVDLPVRPSDLDAMHWVDAVLPDGRAGRVAQLAYFPNSTPDPGDDEDSVEASGASAPERALVLVLARGRESLAALLTTTRAAIAGMVALTLLASFAFVTWALIRGLKPLVSIAREVENIDAHDLAHRFDPTTAPRELAPVAERLNELLQRLEAAFQRERRFSGNVAHELRTPIAELRSLAAVGRRWPDDRDAVVGYFGDVGAVASRMESCIRDLMLLARCEAGVEHTKADAVALPSMIHTVWSRFEEAATRRELRFAAELPADLQLYIDRGKLELVLTNLLHNAVSHSRPGTVVHVTATHVQSAGGRRFRLEITNHSEQAIGADLDRVTEPFWRADPARSPGEHAGLGLALVAALCRLLQLQLEFTSRADDVFVVRLTGPTSPASSAARFEDHTTRSKGDHDADTKPSLGRFRRAAGRHRLQPRL